MKKFLTSRRGKITLVVLVALFLRVYAAFQLPLDFDEPIYMQNAFDYARLLRAGDWQGVIDYTGTPEHPPLTRLLYSATILPLNDQVGWSEAFVLGRLVSVIFGTLAVWVLALIDPLAGLLLALQTYSVKYTSQAYLEALPLFASLAALVALRFSKAKRDRWFWLSAGAMGLTAAGKYSYFPIFLVVLFIFFVDKKYHWKDLLLFVGVAGLTFLILDPALWRNPVERLVNSLFFHTQYAQGQHVQEVGYPWYQPLKWLSKSYPYEWNPEVFFYNPLEGIFSIDGLIFLSALGGILLQWRGRRYVVVWMAVGVIALLLWPTKWPQYTLMVVPAFCLSASWALKWIFGYFQHLEDYYGWISSMIPLPSVAVWVVALLAIGFFGGFTILGAVNMYQARQGWSHVLKDQSPLPSNQIYALAATPQGEMVVGTDAGALIWRPAEGEIGESWQAINRTNSDLPDDHVLSVQVAPDEAIWFGTTQGAARYDGKDWQVFGAEQIGLPAARVFDMQFDSAGRLWLGTNGGAAVYDGQGWTAFTKENSGLGDNLVLSVGTEEVETGEKVYFGTGDGLYAYLLKNNQWERIQPERFNRESGGITDLLVDSKGRLWAATLGLGLHVWDGVGWKQYTVANSDIPSNRIDQIEEDGLGNLWAGASFPDQPGGVLARFNGEKWKIFKFRYTGYSGGATVAVARDLLNRMWFGTQTMGIDIFDLNQER